MLSLLLGKYLNGITSSCEELTHWKRLWCWEGLGAGGEGDDRGWDGWMASLTRWMWVWVNSGSWWWTGRPGVLQFMGSQRVRHDLATELNWTDGAFKSSDIFLEKKVIYVQSCTQERLYSGLCKYWGKPQKSPKLSLIALRNQEVKVKT